MHPEVELLEVEVVRGIDTFARWVLGPLTFKHSQESIVFGQLCLNREAQGLCDLIESLLSLEVKLEPFVNTLEEPTEFAKLVDELSD